MVELTIEKIVDRWKGYVESLESLYKNYDPDLSIQMQKNENSQENMKTSYNYFKIGIRICIKIHENK